MKNTKWISWICLALALPAGAQPIAEDLRLKVQAAVAAVETRGPKLSTLLAAAHEAGAAYFPEITTPVDVDKYQDLEKRRLILGVYLMDMTYATTFQQVQAAAQYGQALYQLLEQLGYPNPDMERRYREALEQINEPGGNERLQALFKEQDADAQWQKMLGTPEGLEVVIDGQYAFLVEGLYIMGELAVQSDYDPMYVQYVADLREALRAFNQVLLLFANEPELAALVQQHERATFINNMLTSLSDLPVIDENQIKALRPMITQARNAIVN